MRIGWPRVKPLRRYPYRRDRSRHQRPIPGRPPAPRAHPRSNPPPPSQHRPHQIHRPQGDLRSFKPRWGQPQHPPPPRDRQKRLRETPPRQFPLYKHNQPKRHPLILRHRPPQPLRKPSPQLPHHRPPPHPQLRLQQCRRKQPQPLRPLPKHPHRLLHRQHKRKR